MLCLCVTPQVRKSALGPHCLFIFVAPPSHEELERRLRHRGTETEDKVLQRLANAESEIAKAQVRGSSGSGPAAQGPWGDGRTACVSPVTSIDVSVLQPVEPRLCLSCCAFAAPVVCGHYQARRLFHSQPVDWALCWHRRASLCCPAHL